jgi:hypothetical protein
MIEFMQALQFGWIDGVSIGKDELEGDLAVAVWRLLLRIDGDADCLEGILDGE